MERRKSNRYELRLPVEFTWMDSTGVEHKANGSTLNISAFGAYVWCYGLCPPVGTPVILDVKLPPRQERSLQAKGGGLVIRVEEILGSQAFAVMTDFHLKEDDFLQPV